MWCIARRTLAVSIRIAGLAVAVTDDQIRDMSVAHLGNSGRTSSTCRLYLNRTISAFKIYDRSAIKERVDFSILFNGVFRYFYAFFEAIQCEQWIVPIDVRQK